jgi:hypothetical protein
MAKVMRKKRKTAIENLVLIGMVFKFLTICSLYNIEEFQGVICIDLYESRGKEREYMAKILYAV